MEPTKEQIQEFWELCGFKFSPKTEEVRFGSPQPMYSTDNYWIYPDGKYHHALPLINLNNLFKYAVPRLTKQSLWCTLSAISQAPGYSAFIESNEGLAKPNSVNTDPALALFWAIWEVLRGEK
jgi:hypothetical protein